jgi:hypothetical protein
MTDSVPRSMKALVVQEVQYYDPLPASHIAAETNVALPSVGEESGGSRGTCTEH